MRVGHHTSDYCTDILFLTGMIGQYATQCQTDIAQQVAFTSPVIFFFLAVGCNGIAARAWASPHAQTLLFDNALTTQTRPTLLLTDRDSSDCTDDKADRSAHAQEITTPARTFRGGVVSSASRSPYLPTPTIRWRARASAAEQ